jgi:hypothetical protein
MVVEKLAPASEESETGTMSDADARDLALIGKKAVLRVSQFFSPLNFALAFRNKSCALHTLHTPPSS